VLVKSPQKGHKYRLLMGLSFFNDRKGTRQYDIESVRVPKERISLYNSKKDVGPYDIALIRTTKTVVFEPGLVMPVCLGNVNLEKSNAIISGFGAFAAKGKGNTAACFTNVNSPKQFKRCTTFCNNDKNPQSEICQEFFMSFGGVKSFREKERADIAQIGDERCYATEGSGEYGWCKVNKSGDWGFCTRHCSLGKVERETNEMQEAGQRVLTDENCETLIPGSMTFTKEVDVCAAQVTTNSQVVKEYEKNGEHYTFVKDVINKTLTVGGSDACQGDSGGPLVKFQKFNGKKKAFLIGLVSRGEGCAYGDTPGMYVRVPAYLTWLQENMETKDSCEYI